jgi:hypothetical protein
MSALSIYHAKLYPVLHRKTELFHPLQTFSVVSLADMVALLDHKYFGALIIQNSQGYETKITNDIVGFDCGAPLLF